MPTGKDIDHYKLLSVHEYLLDNCQQYLDALCFPSLFPTGQYGGFHPCSVKLTFIQYVKSRKMNCDSRFRKNAEFVFYYLWQRELSAGIYNVMNSAGKIHLSVKQFVDEINSSDPGIEANLSVSQRHQTILVPQEEWCHGNDKRIWFSNFILNILLCRI